MRYFGKGKRYSLKNVFRSKKKKKKSLQKQKSLTGIPLMKQMRKGYIQQYYETLNRINKYDRKIKERCRDKIRLEFKYKVRDDCIDYRYFFNKNKEHLAKIIGKLNKLNRELTGKTFIQNINSQNKVIEINIKKGKRKSKKKKKLSKKKSSKKNSFQKQLEIEKKERIKKHRLNYIKKRNLQQDLHMRLLYGAGDYL